MDEFEMASPELRDRRRTEQVAKRCRRREERMPNFFVIEDPGHVRHNKPISFRRLNEGERQGSSQGARRPGPAGTSRRGNSPERSLWRSGQGQGSLQRQPARFAHHAATTRAGSDPSRDDSFLCGGM
ncbi:hypothetical protein V3C99_004535 [Haemonchus contortus]